MSLIAPTTKSSLPCDPQVADIKIIRHPTHNLPFQRENKKVSNAGEGSQKNSSQYLPYPVTRYMAMISAVLSQNSLYQLEK